MASAENLNCYLFGGRNLKKILAGKRVHLALKPRLQEVSFPWVDRKKEYLKKERRHAFLSAATFLPSLFPKFLARDIQNTGTRGGRKHLNQIPC